MIGTDPRRQPLIVDQRRDRLAERVGGDLWEPRSSRTVRHSLPKLFGLYVAMTRGRHNNTARIYERVAEGHAQGRWHQSLVRGNPAEAAKVLRSLIARDIPTQTAHEAAS